MSTRKRSDDDFAREIDAHLELETERLIEDGLSPDEARAAARRRFGNVTAVRERRYEAGRVLWLDHLVQDLRCGWRNLRRYPIASTVAILSLAAGIGATTVTLTIRDVVFRKPPAGYAHPEQLSTVQVGSPRNPIRGPIGNAVPAPLYQKWSDDLGSAIAAAASRGEQAVRVGDRTEMFRERAVSSELFQVLGVAPIAGVGFPTTPAAPQLARLAAALRRPDRRHRPGLLDRRPTPHRHRRDAARLLVFRDGFAHLDGPRRAAADAGRDGQRHDAAAARHDAGDARGATPAWPRRIRRATSRR
jgi:hypothetical protein